MQTEDCKSNGLLQAVHCVETMEHLKQGAEHGKHYSVLMSAKYPLAHRDCPTQAPAVWLRKFDRQEVQKDALVQVKHGLTHFWHLRLIP